MASRRKKREALAEAPPPKAPGYASIERENYARETNSACAWYCAGEVLRTFICRAAGVPDAASKFVVSEITERERKSIVNALREPEIRRHVPDAIYWGLVQLELVSA